MDGGDGGDGSAGQATARGGAGAIDDCTSFGTPALVGSFEPEPLNGPSGIVASRRHPGVVYAHLDAGDTGRFFAVDTTGKLLGEYGLSGATTTDWEDPAIGNCGDGTDCLYFGDIGDNAARTGSGTPRRSLAILRVPEPEVAPDQDPVSITLSDFEIFSVTYPDAVSDAEALMFDPKTQDLLLMTKDPSGEAKIYRVPANLPANANQALEAVGVVSLGGSQGQGLLVSAGDIAENGDMIAIRTYDRILIWTRSGETSIGETLREAPTILPWPDEPQGEGLSFSADGRSLWLAGEQSRNLYRADEACD